MFGIKTGTGITATGAQGLVISAASTGARWSMDFNDPDLDTIGLYGSSFIHASDLLLNDIAVEAISSLYIDVTSVDASGSLHQKISVVNPDSTTGVAFMTLADLTDTVEVSFESSGVGGISNITGSDVTLRALAIRARKSA